MTTPYNGTKCPNCNSDNITTYDDYEDAAFIIKYVQCDDCGASWDENYHLVGYNNLELPDEHQETPPCYELGWEESPK